MMFRTLFAAAALSAACLAAPPAPAAIVGVSLNQTFAIDEVTGFARRIGSNGGNEASKDAAGHLVTSGFDEALWRTTVETTDQATGTLLASLPLSRTPVDIRGLAIAPSGTIYAVENGGGAGGVSENDHLIEIDPVTGLVTTIGTLTISSAQALEFDHAGRLLVSSFFDLYVVDTTTAALTPLLSYSDNLNIQTLLGLPDGRLIGGSNIFYEFDVAGGTVSEIFTVQSRFATGSFIRGAIFDPTIAAMIPLPGAGIALATALSGLGFWRRRPLARPTTRAL